MFRRYLLKAALLIVSINSMAVIAAEDVSTRASEARMNAGLNTESLMQVIIALISVVALIFILSVVVKRFNLLPSSSAGTIKVIAGLSLNAKDRLLVVQVGQEQILISASPGRISKIHELSSPIELESNESPKADPENKFSNILSTIASGRKS